METSKEIIDRAKKRFKELEHKNYDWKSFYTGFLEATMQVKNYESLDSVSESSLIEELRLKLIGMECFADEYYNDKAKEGTRTVFQELKNWINKKRELYSR